MAQEFLETVKESFENGSFVKLSLGGYSGEDPTLKKIVIRAIVIKREDKLSFTYTHKTKDIVKNYSLDEALQHIYRYFEEGFKTATLFTTEYDLFYPSLKKTSASETQAPSRDHDRTKHRYVETAGRKYLQDLKITDTKGVVFKSAQDKYKQIDKYVEILAGLIKNLPPQKVKTIVDMGSGKGYLTFALYDYLSRSMQMDVTIEGVEYRPDMVSLCNRIAGDSQFEKLSFVEGTIENYDASAANILIALHACDTATDDAIAKGIFAQSDLIVVAPCCHKQIRKEMEGAKKGDLDFLLRYGTFMERQAEMVTDGIRALILEYFGYSVKVFEFISDAHTPKNVMIVAERRSAHRNESILRKISDVKNNFGIKNHYLEGATGISAGN